MGIQERSIGRALEKVVGQQENDTTFLSLRDRMIVDMWQHLLPGAGGMEKVHETMQGVATALGKLGLRVTIYRDLNEGGGGMYEPATPVRIHVDMRQGVEQTAVPYPDVSHGGIREVYATTPTESE